MLDKTEKYIDVVRNHVRRKLNVPADQDLRKHLMELLVDKMQMGLESRKIGD